MNPTLTRLIEERATQATFIEELLAHVEQENRDLVDAERQNITAAETRMAELDAQIEPLKKFEERRAAAVVITDIAAGSSRPAASVQVVEHRSLGDIFVESEEFRSYSGRGTSQVITVPEFRAVGPDPLLTTTDPGKKLLPQSQRFAGPEHFVPFPLLSLVGRIEVSGNSVSYVTTSDASGADVVAEGAPKPPVVWTATETPYTLETVAGWFKFSRQALADIPQLRSLVDQKIRRAIDVKLNALAVAALNGAFTSGNTTTGASNAPLVEVVRLAIADMEEKGIMPTAVLANPADVAAFDIAMLGKPLGAAQINGGMWGLPIIPLAGITAGTAVVGDIREGLVWFERAGLEMYTTDSDVSDGAAGAVKSDFRANILTTLGEVRGKFAAVDPSVLQKVVVTP
jgi:HK97 family phage major capsid protein